MAVIRDVRAYLDAIEKIGELKRITREVDWNEEMAAITYMVARDPAAPALLFEKITGYSDEYRVLFNMLGSSANRIGVALGLGTGLSVADLIQRIGERLSQRIPPRIIDRAEAPVNENIVFGDDVDLGRFPAPKMWPLDGGRYIGTGDVSITKDPDTGRLNVGTYRQMIHARNRVGFYTSPGKDATLHRDRYAHLGTPMPVAAAYGVDPVLFLVGTQGFPKNLSEYDVAGGLLGEPVEVVKGEVTDLLLPAHAEIVIEGVILPGGVMDEGPFGEFTGYYGRPEGPTPYIDVQCVHFRNRPILTAALMADYPSNEAGLIYSIVKAAKIWDDLRALGVPGIKGVYAHPAAAGGFGMVIVSIEQKHAGHAQQVAALAAQCPGGAYYTKWIVVVDEDVDPTDINQVLWALATRCNPIEDIDFLRNTWSTWLDPTQNPPDERPYGSKALINACMEHKHKEVFARRSRLSRATYERVCARWRELGLPGVAPRIQVFEGEGGTGGEFLPGGSM